MKRLLLLLAAGLALAGTARAEDPIKFGAMYPLTGGGAIYGVPAMAGHQLAIDEINKRGGIMGRQIVSVERDDKMNPSAASATMKELITKDHVNLVIGGLASSVGLAMSEVSKQEKVVYISTIPKSIQITTTKLHPYVFRIASNTDIEGETMAMLAGKYNLKKICELQLDYAYGDDLEAGIAKAMPKYAPNAKIILTLKPKLGATDFNAFIPQVMASGCDGVLSGLWGPHFISWVKQAAPLGFFQNIKWISGGEIAAPEVAGNLKGEYPDNVVSNAYELWYHPIDASHKAFQEALAKKLGTVETPQWALLGYNGVLFAAAAIEKAQSLDSDKIAQALEGMTVKTPVGPLTIDAKTHQSNTGQFWGPMVKKPGKDYRVMDPVEFIQPKS